MRKLLDTRVNVGMGVDGSASSDSGHLLQEVRLAMLLQRATGSATGESRHRALQGPYTPPPKLTCLLHINAGAYVTRSIWHKRHAA